MDYRGYENKFNEVKKSITDFLIAKNQKVLEYANGTVKSYLDLLEKNDISVKSFKLKIIHSEQTCKKNVLDLEQMLNESVEEIKAFLNNLFTDYEKNLQNYRFYQNRKSDLLLINSHLKRKRQDALVRINNYQKDSSTKSKEKTLLVNEKIKNHNMLMVELNRRLSIDLQRCLDNCSKEYLPLERELLDIDDNDLICEIKEKIKNIRDKSLEKQSELKIKYFSTILEEETKLANETEQIEVEYEKLKNEFDIRVLECKKNIQLHQLEENRNSFDYDYAKDVEAIATFKNSIYQYIGYVTKINEGILNNNDFSNDYEFVSRFKIVKTSLNFYKYGFFNPVIRILDGFSKLIDLIDEDFSKYLDEYRTLRNSMYSQISDRLEKIDESVFKNKKTNLDDFAESIDLGLNNLYLDQYLHEEKNHIMKFVMEILDIIIDISNGLNNDSNNYNYLNKKDFNFDNILIDKREINDDFDAYDEKLCAINDNIKMLKIDAESYYNSYMKERDKEKHDFSLEEKNKIQKVESNFKLKAEKIEKETKKILDRRTANFQKKIKEINQNYNKNYKETKDNLKYYKNIL